MASPFLQICFDTFSLFIIYIFLSLDNSVLLTVQQDPKVPRDCKESRWVAFCLLWRKIFFSINDYVTLQNCYDTILSFCCPLGTQRTCRCSWRTWQHRKDGELLSCYKRECTQTPILVNVVRSCSLTHHSGPAEARISSNEAPRGTWLALIWLRLVRPGPGPAVSMQRARWKGWWRARYIKGRMRESGFAQPSHLPVLSRANEHSVGSEGAASQAPGISLWSSHTRSLLAALRRSKAQRTELPLLPGRPVF